MAFFNKENFEKLMAELAQGHDLIASLKSLAVLSIPLETAKKHNLLEKMRALVPYSQMTNLCGQVIEKLEKLEEVEDKKKAKRVSDNEKRRLKYQRKREAERCAKNVKLTYSEQLEHPTNVKQEITGATRHPTAAVSKKYTPTLKTTGPKKVAKKPSLLQKAMKDAFKIRKQFK